MTVRMPHTDPLSLIKEGIRKSRRNLGDKKQPLKPLIFFASLAQKMWFFSLSTPQHLSSYSQLIFCCSNCLYFRHLFAYWIPVECGTFFSGKFLFWLSSTFTFLFFFQSRAFPPPSSIWRKEASINAIWDAAKNAHFLNPFHTFCFHCTAEVGCQAFITREIAHLILQNVS